MMQLYLSVSTKLLYVQALALTFDVARIILFKSD